MVESEPSRCCRKQRNHPLQERTDMFVANRNYTLQKRTFVWSEKYEDGNGHTATAAIATASAATIE